MNTFSPSSANRRILLLVSGMSPQIVTETLYALTQKLAQPFLPTEIHLVTTSQGAEQARLNLLAGPRYFEKLCQDYGLDQITFSADQIHIIPDPEGRPLADIRTPAENEATADFIASKVRELTIDPGAALHVSMAGGRKTMGYYAGYALSLFGRPQDRLSHVLVSEGYEGLADFYYPTPKTHTIRGRDNKSLDAAKAEVSLAEIPFVRLREGLPDALLDGRRSFREVIALSQLAEASPALCIDVPDRTLCCQGLKVHLPEADFAFYAWVADQDEPISGQALSEAVLHKGFAEGFLAMYERVTGNEVKMDPRVSDALARGMPRQYLDAKISSINKALKNALGLRLAMPYLIDNINKRQKNNSLYSVQLDDGAITWKWR